MNWLFLLVGVLIGWLLEWLIDVVFWRRRRRDSDRAYTRLKEQLGRSQDRVGELETQVDRYAFRAKEMESYRDELEAARARLAEVESQLAREAEQRQSIEEQLEACRASTVEREQELVRSATRVADLDAALAALEGHEPEAPHRAAEIDAVAASESAEPDDLTRIEGIGPKIAQLLNEHGIWTFFQVKETGAGRLGEILQGAGPRFRLAEAASWPEQARLAAEGAWDHLEKLQDELAAGRATGATGRSID